MSERLGNNERTAKTANLTTLVEDLSESNSEGEVDFAVENRLHPPREKMIYNGNGTSVECAQDVPGRWDEPPKN